MKRTWIIEFEETPVTEAGTTDVIESKEEMLASVNSWIQDAKWLKAVDAVLVDSLSKSPIG